MKFNLRFIITLLIVLAIAAAVIPTIADDADFIDAHDIDAGITVADQLEARHDNKKKTCEASCTFDSDCTGFCRKCPHGRSSTPNGSLITFLESIAGLVPRRNHEWTADVLTLNPNWGKVRGHVPRYTSITDEMAS
ncbi:uncharacterized protein KD926_006178 [Aspergillus affinis]|uniref:uncharacterized protein n=1 Tax=Aspergillus affinis TaxID=1070780 RepID=UPI0022FEA020|nr:uncharacterized protein KD926_006178 [Aspergillus affinis]KAI9042054.1 hypothetical protein KD926_006178 [Aspergillus affinis]